MKVCARTLFIVPLFTGASALGVTLAPGESADLGTPGLIPSGTVLADTAFQTSTFTSDAGLPENFESRVSRNATGTLTFAYITTVASDQPYFNDFSSLSIGGFSGLTTDEQIGATNDLVNGLPATNLSIPSVSRSVDGSTLIFAPFTRVIHQGGEAPSADALTILVTTNATTFHLSDTGYQPQYMVTGFPPPGAPVTTTLLTESRAAYIPGVAALPEPLSLLTLPLALSVLGLRRGVFVR